MNAFLGEVTSPKNAYFLPARIDRVSYSQEEVPVMRTRTTIKTMKALVLPGAALALLTLLFLQSHTAAAPRAVVEEGPVASDTLDLSTIYGKIQFVEHFPDYKVQVVDHFPDLKVQCVEHFPDGPGKWQIVEHFPDFKIQIVDHFPDFTIQYVEHFPGVQ
jgi:hypothetical protein